MRLRCASSSANGSVVASMTTKSLPAPCILAKRTRMARLSTVAAVASAIERRLAGRPRLEATVHPEVLRGIAADLAFDPAVHSRRVGDRILGREIGPRLLVTDTIAGAAGKDLGDDRLHDHVERARHPRRRKQRRRLDAEE